jgi:hypothetical protein
VPDVTKTEVLGGSCPSVDSALGHSIRVYAPALYPDSPPISKRSAMSRKALVASALLIRWVIIRSLKIISVSLERD